MKYVVEVSFVNSVNIKLIVSEDYQTDAKATTDLSTT